MASIICEETLHHLCVSVVYIFILYIVYPIAPTANLELQPNNINIYYYTYLQMSLFLYSFALAKQRAKHIPLPLAFPPGFPPHPHLSPLFTTHLPL